MAADAHTNASRPLSAGHGVVDPGSWFAVPMVAVRGSRVRCVGSWYMAYVVPSRAAFHAFVGPVFVLRLCPE